MMGAVTLIGGVVLIEARPVYTYLYARANRLHASVIEMAVFFALAALVCVLTTVLPLRAAKRRLQLTER